MLVSIETPDDEFLKSVPRELVRKIAETSRGNICISYNDVERHFSSPEHEFGTEYQLSWQLNATATVINWLFFEIGVFY